MIDAKLSQVVVYLGERMDTTTDRKTYMAYAIAKIKIQNLVFELLDKQLEDSLKPDSDLEF